MVHLIVEAKEETLGKVEFVEVKGLGHPDTLCDAVAEKATQALSLYYLQHFKKVLHHNVDKVLLVAGTAKPKFLGGEILTPARLFIAGRVTKKVGNVVVPVDNLVRKAVDKYLSQFKDFSYELELLFSEGAVNLKDVFKRQVQVANDTSIGAASYPLTTLEKLTRDVTDHLVSEAFRKKFLGVGYDIKVLGVRDGKDISLTIALAFVGKHLKDMEVYRQLKHDIILYLEHWTKVAIRINTLDSYEDVSTLYVTVSGLSSEHGDDGQAGRGNRYNGMITPYRPMSIESYAGKNISHPGKIYQVMAQKLAQLLVKKGKLEWVDVYMMTEIGKPLDNPYIVSVKALGKIDLKKIKKIVDTLFLDLEKVQRDLIYS